jgi:predicted phosphodiesterase
VRFLILSDIHANQPALEAVVADAAGGYDRAVCCGDLVGYGADPNPVVDWGRLNVAAVVRGNHDKASTGNSDELEWFNPTARAAALWTMDSLTAENREYLTRLPKGPLALFGFQVLHGSPVDEDEYVVSTWDAAPLSGYIDSPLAFFGHTHLQGGFYFQRNGVRRLEKPAGHEPELALFLQPDVQYLVNPGSVGQPRDGDPRAAYCLYDSDTRTVLYKRVQYDVGEAQRRIRAAGLPEPLAVRLAGGR